MSSLFFFLCFLVAGAFATTNTTLVNVTVYYESLCPDSIDFFINHLISTKDYNYLNYTSNVEIIPYGKVNHTDTTYVCQHGESECSGNKLHACAIKYITDRTMLLNYIGCMMNASTPKNLSLPYPDPKKVCLNEAGKFNDSINNCYSSQEGDSLFHGYEDKTTKFFGTNNITVPFIAFNDKYDETLSQNARKDFRKTLCSKAGVNDDRYCSDVPKSGAGMLSASFAIVPALLFFFYATQ